MKKAKILRGMGHTLSSTTTSLWVGHHPIDKPFAVIDLVSRFEHPRTQRRFGGQRPTLVWYATKGPACRRTGRKRPQQLLELTLFGDFVSIYLGLLNGVDQARSHSSRNSKRIGLATPIPRRVHRGQHVRSLFVLPQRFNWVFV